MLQGIYAAASGMQADMHRMDVISNNLANADTPGYKKGIMVYKQFSERLREILPNSPEHTAGTYADEITTDFSNGDISFTGSPLDMALTGDGFFTVETPQGPAYTRNGAFTMDKEGFLVTQSGHYVLGQNGPINLMGFSSIDISENGVVRGDNIPIDVLSITSFPKPYHMTRAGGELFFPENEGQEEQVMFPGIKQKYLESSNVSSVGIMNEMVGMIQANRHYEANHRVIALYDQMMGKVVNDIAKF